MCSAWPGAVVGEVLVESGLLMNYGTEVLSAGAQAALANQINAMINKLRQIITPVGESSFKRGHPADNTSKSLTFRIVVVFPGAILDKQTGLVWKETPDATLRTWTDATRYCAIKTVGGTIGWRLPSMVELKSVQDLSMAPSSVSTNAFSDFQSIMVWSTSTPAEVLIGGNNSFTFPAWCVRGGVNTQQY